MQLYLNWHRKSTVGWNILNVLLVRPCPARGGAGRARGLYGLGAWPRPRGWPMPRCRPQDISGAVLSLGQLLIDCWQSSTPVPFRVALASALCAAGR